MKIKLPGEQYGYCDYRYTVIASAYIDEEEVGYLLLAPERPYYAYLQEYDDGYGGMHQRHRKVFENIVPATQHYLEQTGCY